MKLDKKWFFICWCLVYKNIVHDWIFDCHSFLFSAILLVFIVIIFFFSLFCCNFHVLSEQCPQRIVFGELALSFNILFVYHVVQFFLYFSLLRPGPQITTPPAPPGTIWPYLNVLIDWECFGAPRDLKLLRVNFYWKRGYLYLYLCVPIGSWTDCCWNAYTVLVRTLHFTVFATQKEGLQLHRTVDSLVDRKSVV